MIQRRQAASQMIRLLIGRRDGHPEADRFCHSRYSWYRGKWFMDWPLRPGSNRRIERLRVHVVAAEDVSDEDAVDFASLKELSQVCPMRQGIELVRLVGRM